MRTNFDFTPYRRSTVGFDRLFDMLESAGRTEGDSWPPFDLEQLGDDAYRITIAIPGFSRDEIEIVAQQHQLTVTGRKDEATGERRYLHRGIAHRHFERRFELADFVEVQSARYEDGLLVIDLNRVIPEAMKPRRVAIESGAANDRLEAPAEDREAA